MHPEFSLSVLLVEDDETFRHLVATQLRALGVELTLVSNAEEALALLERQEFHLLIIDWMLPGRDGIALTAQIREYHTQTEQDPYIVLMTGNAQEMLLDIALKSGADDFLYKPSEVHHLTARLKVAVRLAAEKYRRLHAEHHLARSREQLRAILEDQTEFIARFTPDGTIKFANEAFCRLVNRPRADVVEGNILTAEWASRSRWRQRSLKVLTPENSLHRYETSDTDAKSGRKRYQEWTDRGFFDEMGNLVEVQSVGRDITRQFTAEQSVMLRDRALEAVLNGVVIISREDHGFVITYANHAFRNITGYSQEDLGQLGWSVFLGPDLENLATSEFLFALENCTFFTGELSCQRKTGDRFWAEITLAPIFGPMGSASHFVSVVTDISERKREERLEEDRRQLLEQFVNNQGVEHLLSGLLDLIEHQFEGSSASILLPEGDHFKTIERSATDPSWRSHIESPEFWRFAFAKRLFRHEVQLWAFADLCDSIGDPVLGGLVADLPFQEVITLSLGRYGSKHDVCLFVLLPRRTKMHYHTDRLMELVRHLSVMILGRGKLLRDLQYHSQYDALTRLPNRSMLESILDDVINRAMDSDDRFAVLTLDLDRFKHLNDSHGLATGDKVLQQVARRLELMLRDSDFVGRLSSDEFLIVLPTLSHRDDVVRVAQRCIDMVNQPYQVGENVSPVSLGVSVGIALFPNDGQTIENLLRNSHAALHQAKFFGKNSYCFFQAQYQERIARRVNIESRLREAIDNGHLKVYYQPLFSLETLKPCGAEGLVRWMSPEEKSGIIYPGEFITIAEETGMIFDIWRYVLRSMCDDYHQMVALLPDEFSLSLNVSFRQFTRRDFATQMLEELHTRNVPCQRVTIEVTESSLMDDREQSISHMHLLRENGIRIALDDFGTGYSSLSYLHYLPIDTVKIDKSFIHGGTGITSSPEWRRYIVNNITSMAQYLKLETVLEGVEEQSQLDFAREVGVNQVQGYLLSKPLPFDKLREFLGKNQE